MLPIAGLAAVHCAAATENFMVLENHTVDQLEQWSSLVEGLPVPLIENGHINLREGIYNERQESSVGDYQHGAYF